jgi:hypothetical protein
MWKGEWKAYVAWWLGWPLIALVVTAVAVCVIASKRRGPDAVPVSRHQVK